MIDTDLTVGLPAPRDDEPPNLRRDIADELGDHLACAMQRELQQTDDEQQAHATAISKFGFPQQIARRLWWDAMQEKIMSHRMTLAAAGVALAACLGVVAFSWMTFNRMNEAAQQTREVNLALLSKLEKLAAPQPVQVPPSLEWTEVRFHLSLEEEGGKPAEGFGVQLIGNAINSSAQNSMTLGETSGSDGTIKFGPIRPGEYNYIVDSPWNQRTYGHFVALPGPRTDRNIACPAGPPEEGTVQIDIEMGDLIREYLKTNEIEHPWVYCVFERVSALQTLGDQSWDGNRIYSTLLADGKLIEGMPRIPLPGAGPLSASMLNRSGRSRASDIGSLFERTFQGEAKTTVRLDELKERDAFNWPTGKYVLTHLVLLSHKPDPDDAGQMIVTAHGGETFDEGGADTQSFQLKAAEENHWDIVKPKISFTGRSSPSFSRGGRSSATP